MPVTRSSSRQHSHPPPNQTRLTARRPGLSGSGNIKKSTKPPSNEIIVLSSDDDEPPPKGTLLPKGTSNRSPRKKAALPVNLGDVLEISSEDDGHSEKLPAGKRTRPSEATNGDLQNTIEKLREELKRSERLLASTSKEVEELKRCCSDKDILSGLGEYTACEVCTLTMWCPYTLPQCGHSFCEGCLVDWFSTTHAQYMSANPQLEDNRATLAVRIQTLLQMVPNMYAFGVHGQHHMQAILDELRRHRPEYTCPSCRKAVLNKPIEDFRLKELIRVIAGLSGEAYSPKDTSHRRFGPFDNFFAAPTPG